MSGGVDFAMKAEKISLLAELITEFELLHVMAFPSILRLISDDRFLEELLENKHRLESLQSVSFHRVIDNEPMSLQAKDLWIQLNYQLVHFVDFLPAANWDAK